MRRRSSITYGHGQSTPHDDVVGSAAADSADGVAFVACGDAFSGGGERASSVPSFSRAASAL